jgi:surface carbohydrate biosynthesis protein
VSNTRGEKLPTVVLPIETVARELDSKFVTASALAARGLRIVVAHKETAWRIGEDSRRIVWVGKNLFSDHSDNHFADRLIANASAILFIQDEGGIFQVNTWAHNVLQKQHVDQVRSRRIDRVLMWGRRQKEVFDSHAPESNSGVVVTGSPRFDLCAPEFAWMTEESTNAIKARYGSYILACTRFTAIAHAQGLADPFRRKLNPRIWPDGYDMGKLGELWFSKWRRDVHDFADFVFLVKAIADRYPERCVVLRPHPSESIEFYKAAFSTAANVAVIREGDILSWLRGADLVVHSDCTTGIEGAIAGRPVVNYLPADAPRGDTDIEVAREAGVVVGSFDDAMDAVDTLISGGSVTQVWSPNAISILNNLDRKSIPLLVEEVLAVTREKKINATELVLPVKRPIKQILKRMAGRTKLYSNSYIASKRPPLDRGKLEDLLAGCKMHGLGTGRIVDFEAQYVVIDPD